MSQPKRVALLGATGSIGKSTLEVIRAHPGRFEISALTAWSRSDELFALCCEFAPAIAVVGPAVDAGALQSRLRERALSTRVLQGAQGLNEAAGWACDLVVAAIVGAAGLEPTLAAIRAGKQVLLANKEALVCGGRFFMAEVQAHGAQLLPVDSEHNAIFQCLEGQHRGAVSRLILTASGGPFLRTPSDQLARITPAQACAHPNWVMGAKISVDSATMMNKGLEVIEARWLFDCPVDKIEVVIHPQSIVHSLVAYRDGTTLAQLSHPDMRVPIAHALLYPERGASGVAALDLARQPALTFEQPNLQRFPCLRLALDAARHEGDYPLFLNAANEISVAAFLKRQLAFTDIHRVNAETMAQARGREPGSLDDVLELDTTARRIAAGLVEQISC